LSLEKEGFLLKQYALCQRVDGFTLTVNER
jgi:hypothetical protein